MHQKEKQKLIYLQTCQVEWDPSERYYEEHLMEKSTEYESNKHSLENTKLEAF